MLITLFNSLQCPHAQTCWKLRSLHREIPKRHTTLCSDPLLEESIQRRICLHVCVGRSNTLHLHANESDFPAPLPLPTATRAQQRQSLCAHYTRAHHVGRGTATSQPGGDTSVASQKPIPKTPENNLEYALSTDHNYSVISICCHPTEHLGPKPRTTQIEQAGRNETDGEKNPRAAARAAKHSGVRQKYSRAQLPSRELPRFPTIPRISAKQCKTL